MSTWRRTLRVRTAAWTAAVLAVLLAAGPPAAAVVFEPRDFTSPEQEARYKTLIHELRCLVCQNQNIADSNAPLAQDLRREVFRMLEEGRSDDQIADFMITRYGDFVLYRPPFNALTLALWAGPAVLVLIGLTVLGRALRARRRAAAPPAALSAEERRRLDALVGAEADDGRRRARR